MRGGRAATADDDLLDAYSRAVVGVVEQVGPAVVSIAVRKGRKRRSPGGEGSGSGVVITPDGFALTNQHVIEDAEAIEVRLIDGNSYPLTPLGVSNSLRAGQLAIAIGSRWASERGLHGGSRRSGGRFAASPGAIERHPTDLAIFGQPAAPWSTVRPRSSTPP
jgi:S1-C subfamily serine protease